MFFCCCIGWKIILVGSCFIYVVEFCYFLIEGEVFVVVNVFDKVRFFVFGCSDLIVVVDYKFLFKVFGD